MKTQIALLWDLDGTLMNTHPNTVESFIQYLSHNHSISDFTYQDYETELNGMTLEQQVDKINERYNLLVDVDEFRPAVIDIQKELMHEQGFRVDPYLERFLRESKSRGLNQVIVTSSIRYRAEDYLKIAQIEDLFDFLVTKDDVKMHKPHPDAYLLAAEKLKIDPSRCVVFEDSQKGMDAARAAGMKAVGVEVYLDRNNGLNLRDSDTYIDNYKDLNFKVLESLFIHD